MVTRGSELNQEGARWALVFKARDLANLAKATKPEWARLFEANEALPEKKMPGVVGRAQRMMDPMVHFIEEELTEIPGGRLVTVKSNSADAGVLNLTSKILSNPADAGQIAEKLESLRAELRGLGINPELRGGPGWIDPRDASAVRDFMEWSAPDEKKSSSPGP